MLPVALRYTLPPPPISDSFKKTLLDLPFNYSYCPCAKNQSYSACEFVFLYYLM
jgi:hypothetical protein